MMFQSTPFHSDSDEVPQELNSCLYPLAYGKIGFMLFCFKSQNLSQHEVHTTGTIGTTGLSIKPLSQVSTPGQSAVAGIGSCDTNVCQSPSPHSRLWEVNFR